MDVYPDHVDEEGASGRGVPLGGYEMLVRVEAFRGRYRNGYDRPEPFEPGVATRVAFPLQDVLHTFKRGHRLIELARRFSSSMEIRQPHPDYRHFNEAFLIADACGLLQRGLADRFEGSVNFYTPVIAQRKLDFFTEVWERSEAHPEMRRLHL